MKRVLYVLLVVALALTAFSASVLAKNDKVDICHVKGNGDVKLINVSQSAVPAHLAHGDGYINDPVPGMDDYVFGEDCQPVYVPPCDYNLEVTLVGDDPAWYANLTGCYIWDETSGYYIQSGGQDDVHIGVLSQVGGWSLITTVNDVDVPGGGWYPPYLWWDWDGMDGLPKTGNWDYSNYGVDSQVTVVYID